VSARRPGGAAALRTADKLFTGAPNVAETDQGHGGDLLPDIRNHDPVHRDDPTRQGVLMPPVWIRVPKLPTEVPRAIARPTTTQGRPRLQSTSVLVGLAGVVVFTMLLYWMLPGRGAAHAPASDDRGPPIWNQKVREFHDQAFQPGQPDETDHPDGIGHPTPTDVGMRYQAVPDPARRSSSGAKSRVFAELEGTIEARPQRR